MQDSSARIGQVEDFVQGGFVSISSRLYGEWASLLFGDSSPRGFHLRFIMGLGEAIGLLIGPICSGSIEVQGSIDPGNHKDFDEIPGVSRPAVRRMTCTREGGSMIPLLDKSPNTCVCFQANKALFLSIINACVLVVQLLL